MTTRTGVGRAVLVLAVVILLAWRVGAEVGTISGDLKPGSVHYWRSAQAQQTCIYHAIRADLPKGAKIFVADTPGYNYLRLDELATSWAVPTLDQGEAQWSVALVAGTQCEGLLLRVARL